MAGPGAGLKHRPDIVLRGFDGPQSFTLLDIKTFDAAGVTPRQCPAHRRSAPRRPLVRCRSLYQH